jgi:hypothetical protein
MDFDLDRARISIPTLLSAIAVALSLIFVGFEIRQNTAAQRSGTIEGIAGQRIEFNIATWTDDQMPGLLRRLREGAVAADFTPDDVQKIRVWYITYLRIQESAYRQVAVGVIGEDDYNISGPIHEFAFLKEQWPTLQLNFEQGFIDFMEAKAFR